jgi:hypothetical protein
MSVWPQQGNGASLPLARAPMKNAGKATGEQAAQPGDFAGLGGRMPLALVNFVSRPSPRCAWPPLTEKGQAVSNLSRRLGAIGGLVGLLAVIACTSDPTLVPPSTTVPATIENFSGVVPVRGSSTHNFIVRKSNGQMTVTLVSAGLPDRVVMGLGIGVPTATACTVLPGASVNATPAVILPHFDVTVQAGSYCVVVSDNGSQTAPVSYVVQVTHY